VERNGGAGTLRCRSSTRAATDKPVEAERRKQKGPAQGYWRGAGPRANSPPLNTLLQLPGGAHGRTPLHHLSFLGWHTLRSVSGSAAASEADLRS
jgi:hypothetical protein